MSGNSEEFRKDTRLEFMTVETKHYLNYKI